MATANSTATRRKPAAERAGTIHKGATHRAKGRLLEGVISIGPRAAEPPRYMLASDRRSVDKAMEILASYLRSPSSVFSSPESVREYICLHLGVLPYEVFGVLFLDSQHRLIVFEQMFRGTLTQTSVYPREVVTRALEHRAASVVLTHNHPGGSTQPSRADEALTQTLKAALALVDVRVLDHFVVAGNQAGSMAEMGLLCILGWL